VLYTAQDFETAVVEVFGDAWLGTRVLARSELEGFDLLEFAVRGNLRVADLTGRALSLLGTDARLFATRDYETTRAWSKRLMEHPRAADGLRYPSRKNPKKLNYALYDTPAVRAGLSLAGRTPLLEHPSSTTCWTGTRWGWWGEFRCAFVGPCLAVTHPDKPQVGAKPPPKTFQAGQGSIEPDPSCRARLSMLVSKVPYSGAPGASVA
jgi:hypothetical protein